MRLFASQNCYFQHIHQIANTFDRCLIDPLNRVTAHSRVDCYKTQTLFMQVRSATTKCGLVEKKITTLEDQEENLNTFSSIDRKKQRKGFSVLMPTDPADAAERAPVARFLKDA